MWLNTQQIRTMAALSLAACLCGAPPQNEQGRRATPQPMPATSEGGGTEGIGRSTPMPMGPRGFRPDPSNDGPMGRGGSRRFTPMPRVNQVATYPGTRIIIPPAWSRCTVFPTATYWRGRDLMAEIQWLSRRGFLPVTPVGPGVSSLSDYTQQPAGWRAYGVAVPAGGTLQVEVHHAKLGWFRLMLVNKWGEPGAGMLRAAHAYQPVMVTYKNPGKEATSVYLIVDDPAWWSDKDSPYTLSFRRDWDPLKVNLDQVPMVAGLWGASPSVSAEFRGPSLTGPAVYPH